MNYDESWKPLFYDFPEYINYKQTTDIYPSSENIYRVFLSNIKNIKLVILGQDPYHDGSADGLAFSCKSKIPPSLKNMFKELNNTFPERNYNFVSGDLSEWVEKGIFLLNCSLTVEPKRPNSHIKFWQPFTEATIKYIVSKSNSTFLLLGNNAKKYKNFIPENRYIECGHPSPLSVKHFMNKKVFEKVEKMIGLIDWQN